MPSPRPIIAPSHLAHAGKYRDLIIAIAVFLVLDLGVLLFNYYSSHLIEQDTSRINTAGELRVYSQQLAKAVLTLQQEFVRQAPMQTSLAQVSEARAAFVQALGELDASSPKTGQGFQDESSARSENELRQALHKQWNPIDRDIAPLLSAGGFNTGELEMAANTVVNRNLQLMRLAGELGAHIEHSAVQRASAMRRLQLIAIGLAFLNFAFIVFKFLRNLSQSDRRAEQARNETRRILDTVQEGLFLLTADGRIGSQRSASIDQLLGRRLESGETLAGILENRLDHEQLRAALEYIELLFNHKMKPGLIKQLNPLQEVALTLPSGETRFLDFEFDQVRGLHQTVDYLLVTLFDVSRKVLLERELAGAEHRARSEVDALLAVLEQDPAVVAGCLPNMADQLEDMNRALQSVEARPLAYANLIARIARATHGIKGEAAALGLNTIEAAAHAFEEVVMPLRGRPDLSGDDLIPVAVAMNELREAIARLQSVIARVERFASGRRPETDTLQALFAQMEHLTLRVASDLGKQARLKVHHVPQATVPERMLEVLRTSLPQLVRNALAHGIESSNERLQQGKPATATLQLSIDVAEDGGLQISLRDDGRGLSPAQLRQRLIASGFCTASQVATMSDQAVVAMLFEPGFSQLDEATLHAGRGEGLAVVREAVTRLGGNLRISSRPNSHTQFTLQFGKESLQCA